MRIARIRLEPAPWRGAAAWLGSPRLALALFALLGVAVAAAGRGAAPAGGLLAVPLALLALNLGCAIATHASFRQQPALLVFHVALLALVLLAAAGRLTYLNGTLEISVGEEFSGALTQREQGPLHGDAIERLAFTQLEFAVHYQPGMKRAQTESRVAWRDAAGRPREAVVGDDAPLRLAGYRFYTTPNKGFAPEFVWRSAQGREAMRGTVHLPSYPAQLAAQEQDWTPPGATQPLRLRLEFEERLVDLGKPWILRAPGAH
ncbi:MAG: cytochrome c biogenesis protein ResB, partial [Aquincola sp.]|nr:cytochrome c biogenesis protein ResB [Aquincola sp.]